MKTDRIAVANDGFSVTVELDCGCNLRVNDHPSVPPYMPGDWASCWQHSAVYRYDSSTGDPEYDRDKRVVAVWRER